MISLSCFSFLMYFSAQVKKWLEQKDREHYVRRLMKLQV
jgi:hypothetical protein